MGALGDSHLFSQGSLQFTICNGSLTPDSIHRGKEAGGGMSQMFKSFKPKQGALFGNCISLIDQGI